MKDIVLNSAKHLNTAWKIGWLFFITVSSLYKVMSHTLPHALARSARHSLE